MPTQHQQGIETSSDLSDLDLDPELLRRILSTERVRLSVGKIQQDESIVASRARVVAEAAREAARRVSQEIHRESERGTATQENIEIPDEYAWIAEATAACDLLSDENAAADLREKIHALRPVHSNEEKRMLHEMRTVRDEFMQHQR